MKQLMIMNLLPRFTDNGARQAKAYRQLLREEARMGGELFGPVPAGHRREFFCLDRHTWVWHEEWIDERGMPKTLTTRYDIRPQGILKSQGTNSYQLVHGAELRNFYQAARLFRDNVYAQLVSASQQPAYAK